MKQKIYYNADGWVCGRYPNMFPIEDETSFIEVNEETFRQTLCCGGDTAWKVENGEVILAAYDYGYGILSDNKNENELSYEQKLQLFIESFSTENKPEAKEGYSLEPFFNAETMRFDWKYKQD